MKKAITIFFLTTFLLQNFSHVFVFGNYYLNKKFIAENICDNRDKPQLKCQGKCYLKKKIKQEQKQDNAGASGHQKEKAGAQYFFSDHNQHHFFNIASLQKTQYNSFNDLRITAVSSYVFHPPGV